MNAKNLGLKIDQIYSEVAELIANIPVFIFPYFRRFIRLISLPYCYIFLVNWKECTASKIKVLSDLMYIFFSLKTYPFHYSLCRLWESDRDSWKYYYGSNYEPYQRARLSKEVQPKRYSIIFDDKEVCYQLCKGANIPLPVQVAILDPLEDYKLSIQQIFITGVERIIIKPVLGAGGKNILLAFKENDEIIIRDRHKKYTLSELKLPYRSVVQKYLIQHPLLSKYSKCFSTIRIATMFTTNSEVLVLGAFMRFGLGNSYVDNLSSGGIAVGVDIINGNLKKYAYDFDSKKYTFHPDTQQLFLGFVLPDWQKVLELAIKIQKTFPYYKLLGLDIGLTSDGPVLVEINPFHDNVALEQSYGPILVNQAVLSEFRKYGLLVVDPFNT